MTIKLPVFRATSQCILQMYEVSAVCNTRLVQINERSLGDIMSKNISFFTLTQRWQKNDVSRHMNVGTSQLA